MSSQIQFNSIYFRICIVVLTLGAMSLTGCKPLRINTLRDRIRPSNQRDWKPDVATLPHSEIIDGVVNLHNIRNTLYVTPDDFIVSHHDRKFPLDDIRSVDFVVSPFPQTPTLAHTFLSFGLKDGTYLGVSIEVRKEKEEDYAVVLGSLRQYEITYVVADERDLIRLRTHHRDSDVYVYPTVATPVKAQELFVDVMKRVNKLTVEPEFYNTLLNNCTTNLAGHVNIVAEDRVTWGWKVLLPGFSARYAYDLGLLPNDIPFEDLSALAYVNDLAAEHYDDPNFSQLIRRRHSSLQRLAQRQKMRAPIHNGRGDEFLIDRERARRLLR